MDFTRYVAPGVYTSVVPGPQIGIQGSTPSSVGIFGLGRGYQTDLETVAIPFDAEEDVSAGVTAGPVASNTLRQYGIDPTTIVVSNVATGVVYAQQTTTSPPDGDYVIIPTVGPSGQSPSYDTTYKIIRVDGGTLASGTNVQVTYQYTNSEYFNATTFFDFSDVVNKYGAPFNADGSVGSELSLAARFAFINGAGSVVCAPLTNITGPVVTDYADALAKLEGVDGISVIVCANGNPNIFPYVRDHVTSQSESKHERRAILGMDGSVNTVTTETLQATAKTISNSRVALVSVPTANYFNTSTSQATKLGGQYVAAALAGWVVSHAPQIPLTRKTITGFSSVDSVPEAQKNAETQAGLLVVESNLRVRHGVTTNSNGLLNREWSILGQQDAMAYRMRSYFDDDNLIGSIINDLTLSNVKTSASAALDSLVNDGTIQAATDLKVRTVVNTPDAIEVAYAWSPSLPANYLDVKFTLNVTSGDITESSTL